MNVVPFDPAPLVRGGFRAAPAGFAADAAYNLARQYGPRLANYALRNFGRLGMRAVRAAWRQWGPRPQTFMDRARLALGRAQRTAVRRHVDRMARLGGRREYVKSQSSSQVRGSRGFIGSRRGGTGRSRGGMRRAGRRRMPMRYGGRPMLKPELKSYDLTNNTVPVGPAISLVQVPVRDLTLGVTSNQRVGRKVYAKSLLLVGKIYNALQATVNTTSDSVWFWIVVDRQSNGTTATPSDVWLDTVGSRALKNLDQGPRFKILRCMEVKVDAVAVGTHINQPFELYLPLGITVHWKGLANFPPFKNDILVFASNSNAQNEDLRIEFSTRVRYTDV